jgi:hypothetical protein
MPGAEPGHGAMPGHEGSGEGDGDVPPWAHETAPEDESRWHRICRWFEGEFDAEPCPPRYWVKAEYILAWIRSDHTPPLLTTGLTTDATPGALGLPYTRGAYGGNIDFEDRSGLRLTFGMAINESISVDASYFLLDGRKPGILADSPGSPVIARPFFNVNTGMQDSALTTYPGLVAGNTLIENYSYMEGAELNARGDLLCNDWFRLKGLAGLRWVNLREGLSITDFSTITIQSTPPSPLNGLPIGDQDLFRTRNDFFGGQLGMETEFEYLHFAFNLFGKCAIGDMNQVARIQGATNLLGTVVPGGLFATSSNSGQFTRDRFGVVPEAGLRVERTIGRHVTVFASYSFLYLNDVVRPGSLVDTNVNVNLVPGSKTFGAGATPALPAFHFVSEEFWAHMFQFGMTVHW